MPAEEPPLIKSWAAQGPDLLPASPPNCLPSPMAPTPENLLTSRERCPARGLARTALRYPLSLGSLFKTLGLGFFIHKMGVTLVPPPPCKRAQLFESSVHCDFCVTTCAGEGPCEDTAQEICHEVAEVLERSAHMLACQSGASEARPLPPRHPGSHTPSRQLTHFRWHVFYSPPHHEGSPVPTTRRTRTPEDRINENSGDRTVPHRGEGRRPHGGGTQGSGG